ncbi:hypothetical protein ACTXT7_004241 [Hymenolepis weldensis]
MKKKAALPTRESTSHSQEKEQGERRTLRNLKGQILQKCLNGKQRVNIHNKLYQATPSPRYHDEIVRPNDSGSLKLQTVSSRSSNVNICKNSLINETNTVPSSSVFRNTITNIKYNYTTWTVPYIETSALSGKNVSAAIDMLLDLVMKRIEESVTKTRIHKASKNSNGGIHLENSKTTNKSCAC